MKELCDRICIVSQVLKTEIWLKETQLNEDKQSYVKAMESYKKKLSKARAQTNRVTEDTQRVMDAQQVQAQQSIDKFRSNQ